MCLLPSQEFGEPVKFARRNTNVQPTKVAQHIVGLVETGAPTVGIVRIEETRLNKVLRLDPSGVKTPDVPSALPPKTPAGEALYVAVR